MAKAVIKPSPLLIAAAACAALAALSLLLPSAPTYDPYAWLIWGRDLAHLDLVTRGTGTSWKPFPVLVDALLAPLGRGQPDGWLVVARAGALFACFMSYRLARRIAGPGWGVLAGALAALSLLVSHDFFKRDVVGNAEGLATGLGLLAIERHLDGRRGQAFALGITAGLIRPEAWPFLVAYGCWLWFARVRPPRAATAAAGLLVPLLWLGGDWLGSGRVFGASDQALQPIKNSAGSSPDPALAVLREALTMLPGPARIGVPVALAWAVFGWFRRRRGPAAPNVGLVLVLGAGALAWTLVVAALAARGYPGLPRFLFMAMGLAAVLGGVGAALIGRAAVALAERLRLRPVRRVAAACCVAALAVSVVPDVTALRADAADAETLADHDQGLAAAVGDAGGARGVFGCGAPVTSWYAVTALAYDLGVGAYRIHLEPSRRRPVVFLLGVEQRQLRALRRGGLRLADHVDGWQVLDRCPRST